MSPGITLVAVAFQRREYLASCRTAKASVPFSMHRDAAQAYDERRLSTRVTARACMSASAAVGTNPIDNDCNANVATWRCDKP